MNKLQDILYTVAIEQVWGSTDRLIEGISFDSRQVGPNQLFVAVRGIRTDGHQYIDQAIKSGAVAVICETMPAQPTEGVTYIRVADAADALGIAASNFYGQPGKQLRLIGVTGTNGKTSTVTLLHQVFSALGHPCGLISTVENRIGQKTISAQYTTPDPLQLNQLLSDMVAAGCEYAFMEVSSHALAQKRVRGVHFSGGIFTNITHDHLDYHSSFQEYLKAKKSFFDSLGRQAFAITNADDKNGVVMLQNTRARKKTYGLQTMADFHAKMLESSIAGMYLQIDNVEMWCRLVGKFNAYNLLAAYAVARMLGVNKEELLTALSLCNPPEGRFDHFTGRDQITAIVDYAHTPDALENVLKTINQIRHGNETLITVVGCGGNRDAAKRPIMASIAAANSEKLILTSDNPRNEEPEMIINDMKAGLSQPAIKKTLIITNRKEAIHAACAMAGKGDIILVAGKGHEKYQEIKGIRYPFDDKQILRESLSADNS